MPKNSGPSLCTFCKIHRPIVPSEMFSVKRPESFLDLPFEGPKSIFREREKSCVSFEACLLFRVCYRSAPAET